MVTLPTYFLDYLNQMRVPPIKKSIAFVHQGNAKPVELKMTLSVVLPTFARQSSIIEKPPK